MSSKQKALPPKKKPHKIVGASQREREPKEYKQWAIVQNAKPDTQFGGDDAALTMD
jgi:hypothetical protein